ncbi:uncharacterized protein cubi_00225 [Cryptosporidium ubiquitum]|uniref:Uncharacterized protein n=1 Tax=Cryptosporidium ubiquitum TaxID=857276 RepID=A0A1J4MKD3_9CRYT|nr:uncharacterized protein cubi_00225 [Cryptosporidium ubiquitum]OII74672.1 hypothetical protein cubi_00225 [Cryptosporidium ubiquitum]
MFLSKRCNGSPKNIEFENYSQNNRSSPMKKIFCNQTTALFMNTVSQLLIIDIIFIIFNIYINKYILSYINHIFILVINFAITYTSLVISRRLDIYSSELVSNFEKKINLNITDEISNCELLNLEIQCLDSFRLIKNGIISIVCLLFYPIRFGIFGYIFFNNNWKIFLFVSKVIELLIFTAIFEFLRIKLLIIPEQKSILINISNYFDNLKTLLLLRNHRENYLNSSKTINFKKKLLNYILAIFQSIYIIYFVFGILQCLNENSHKFEFSQIYVFNYWFAIYLIYSVKYINSCILLVINCNHVVTLLRTTKNVKLYHDYSSQNIVYSNNINSEIPNKNQDSELLNEIKDSSNKFEMQKNGFIPHDRHLLVNNIHDNHLNKYLTNYSTSEIVADIDYVKLNGYNSDEKNNTVSDKDKSNSQSSNDTLFNPVIISYKNLYLSLPHENKYEKQIQNSSNLFKYLSNLCLKKTKKQNNFCSNYDDNDLDLINNELMESKFYLNDINLSIKIKEIIIIFGSSNKDKELLTKYISGFPGINSNEQFEYYSTDLFKFDVHLINKNMLEFVSNFYEFQKSEFTIDPFDFILSGNSFNKKIFELVYNSLLSEYFDKSEFMYENNETNRDYIYPKVEGIQQFVEAKIFLQLSQFFYNILISLDDYSSAIVIIDGIFELLLPRTYIKFMEKISPNNSVFSEFNISFIITTNNDSFSYLSYLYNDNSFVKLAIVNGKGLNFINNDKLNSLELKERSFGNLPSIDNTINEVFNTNFNNNSLYSCSKNIYSISGLYFKQFESDNFYSNKLLLFVFFIGLISFMIKIIMFSNQYLIKSQGIFNHIYDFFVFEILSFCPLSSSVGTSTYSNSLSSIFIGYVTISSFFLNIHNTTLFSEINSLKNDQGTSAYGKVFSSEELLKFSRVKPEKNYKSLYFVKFKGKQMLKTTSSFYRDHFFGSEIINIPGISSTGFKNALISTKLIQNILAQKLKKESNSKFLPKYKQFFMGQKNKLKFNKNIILIIIVFSIINIISKIFIYISIFGFSFINTNSMYNYNCFNEFLRIISYSNDPISVINDIELRKNRYFLYLFKEIYIKRSKITMYYFTLIHFLNLLFFFGISNDIYSTNGIEILMNKNLLFITIFFPILYYIIKCLSFNRKKIKLPIIKCNSFDYFYYLNKSNSFSWFKHQTSKLLRIKAESSKEFLGFKLNFLLISLILSTATSYLYFLFNYKKKENNQQLIMDSILFLPIIFFLIQSVHFHVIKTSKTNVSHSLNFYGYLRHLKTSIYKAYYFPTYMKISGNSTSPKTNKSFSPDNKERIQNEDGYELSTPISRASRKTDPILSVNSLPVKLNSNIMFSLINPLLFLDNSLTFELGNSLLLPIKELKTVNINNLDRIAIVSNHNLIPSFWRIDMVLDPKSIYINDNKQLIYTLELLNIFPKNYKNIRPEVILSLSIQEYLELINFQVDDNIFTNEIKTTNIEYGIGMSKSSKLKEQKNLKKNSLLNVIYIKKLLLFGHFTLYSMYYKELILHLDYEMDLNFWISLVKQFFDNKTSSIKNIVIISSDTSLFKVDNA